MVSGHWGPQNILGKQCIWTVLLYSLAELYSAILASASIEAYLKKKTLEASSAVYCWHFGEELVWYKGDTAHCPFMNSHRRYFLQVSVPGRAVPLLAHW